MDHSGYKPPSLYFSKSCLINDIIQKWRELLNLKVGTIVGNSILNLHLSALAKDPRDFDERDLEELAARINETAKAFLSDKESADLKATLDRYLVPVKAVMGAK